MKVPNQDYLLKHNPALERKEECWICGAKGFWEEKKGKFYCDDCLEDIERKDNEENT